MTAPGATTSRPAGIRNPAPTRPGDAIAAAQALVYKAAWRAGDGFPDATEAAQAKIFTSEMAIKGFHSVSTAGRPILGGSLGISSGDGSHKRR